MSSRREVGFSPRREVEVPLLKTKQKDSEKEMISAKRGLASFAFLKLASSFKQPKRLFYPICCRSITVVHPRVAVSSARNARLSTRPKRSRSFLKTFFAFFSLENFHQEEI